MALVLLAAAAALGMGACPASAQDVPSPSVHDIVSQTAFVSSQTAYATAGATAGPTLPANTVDSVGFQPNLAFQWPVPNYYPGLKYYPDVTADTFSPDYKPDWNTTFAEQHFTDETPPVPIGSGNSSTYTTSQNVSLQFEFLGTGFTAFGSLPAITNLTTEVDGATGYEVSSTMSVAASAGASPVSSPILNKKVAERTNLAWRYHQVNLSTDNNRGNLSVESVYISTGMYTKAETFRDVGQRTEAFARNAEPNSWYQYQGNWSASSDDETPTVCNGDCNVHAQVPANTSFITLYGSIGPTFGNFKVQFSPPLTWLPETAADEVFSATNKWHLPGSLLYMTPLNPNVTYTMTVVGVPGQSVDNIGLKNTTYYFSHAKDQSTGLPSSGGKNVSTKTIALAAVFGVLGGLLFAGLLFCCWRRRHRKRRTEMEQKRGNGEPFEIDRDVVEVPRTTPYTYEGAEGSLNEKATESSDGLPPSPVIATGSRRAVNAHGTPVTPTTSSDPAGMHTDSSPTSTSLATPITPTAKPGQRRTPRTRPQPEWPVQEVDGGRVDTQGRLPPSYNPEWAEDLERDRAQDASSTPTDPTGTYTNSDGGTLPTPLEQSYKHL